MPYKDKQKQAEYLKRYRTPYMREYQRFKLQQKRELEKAIGAGNLNLAKEILGKKPRIDIFGRRNSESARECRHDG